MRNLLILVFLFHAPRLYSQTQPILIRLSDDTEIIGDSTVVMRDRTVEIARGPESWSIPLDSIVAVSRVDSMRTKVDRTDLVVGCALAGIVVGSIVTHDMLPAKGELGYFFNRTGVTLMFGALGGGAGFEWAGGGEQITERRSYYDMKGWPTDKKRQLLVQLTERHNQAN